MSSVAAVNRVERNTSGVRGSAFRRRTRTTRRPRTRFWKNVRFVCLAIVLGGAFAYVSLYASLTATSYDRSRLSEDLRAERIKHERLWVDYVRRSSPLAGMSAAQKRGMVYAADYDYLDKSNRVAKAPQGR